MPSVAAVAALASVAAALAVLLLVRPAPAAAAPAGGGSGFAPTTAVVVLVPVVALLLGGPTGLGLALVATAALGVASRIARMRARRREAERTGDQVLRTCEWLAAELGSGRPPGVALAAAADDWPALAPVAGAHRVGSDVPAAWRALADRPGAGDLRLVAAAWQVSQRTGSGLAAALSAVVASLRAAARTRRVVDGELASARATARLMAVLPLLALLMGSGAGGDPWRFLLTSPVGLGCLALGGALAGAGLAWIEALAGSVRR